MTAVTAITATPRASILARVAERYSVEPGKLLETLKATAFKQRQGDFPVSNEQMMALLIVADQFKLNPFTKEIYAFPDKGGIVPVVGVDGWARIINEHSEFDGLDFEETDDSCTATIYRKDRSHPVRVTEYLRECKRDTQPWKSHPKRMLRHKALIQCARLAFGFAGIYDQDEAERIRDMGMADEVKPESSIAKVRAVAAGKVDGSTGEILEANPAIDAYTNEHSDFIAAMDSVGPVAGA
jgi:phage recombination protein Bet